jgi:hypothetical protein
LEPGDVSDDLELLPTDAVPADQVEDLDAETDGEVTDSAGPSSDGLEAAMALLDVEVMRSRVMNGGDVRMEEEPAGPTLHRPTLAESRRRGVSVPRSPRAGLRVEQQSRSGAAGDAPVEDDQVVVRGEAHADGGHAIAGGVEVAPGAVEVAPGEVEVAPDEVEVAPGAVEVAPGEVEVAPGAVEVAPDTEVMSEEEVAADQTAIAAHEAAVDGPALPVAADDRYDDVRPGTEPGAAPAAPDRAGLSGEAVGDLEAGRASGIPPTPAEVGTEHRGEGGSSATVGRVVGVTGPAPGPELAGATVPLETPSLALPPEEPPPLPQDRARPGDLEHREQGLAGAGGAPLRPDLRPPGPAAPHGDPDRATATPLLERPLRPGPGQRLERVGDPGPQAGTEASEPRAVAPSSVEVDPATGAVSIDIDGTDTDGTDADGTDADGTDTDGTDTDGTQPPVGRGPFVEMSGPSARPGTRPTVALDVESPVTEPIPSAEQVPSATVARFHQVTGIDLGFVPVLRGHHVERMARHVDAAAYTAGGVIHVPDGRGDLSRTDNERLLAHELTHVAQSRLRGAPLPGDVAAWEEEAVSVAAHFDDLSSPPPVADMLVSGAGLRWSPEEGFVSEVAPTVHEVLRRSGSVSGAGASESGPREPEPPRGGPPSGEEPRLPVDRSDARAVVYPDAADEAEPAASDVPEVQPPLALTEDEMERIAARIRSGIRISTIDFDDPDVLDALAGNLFDRVTRRLRTELIYDRERRGALTEFN